MQNICESWELGQIQEENKEVYRKLFCKKINIYLVKNDKKGIYLLYFFMHKKFGTYLWETFLKKSETQNFLYPVL